MPLSDIVDVNVSLSQPGVTQAGFGVPLILTQETPLAPASWTTRTRPYDSLADVAADWAPTTAAYAAAEAMFDQTPAPGEIRIGLAVTSPVTQQYAVSVVVTTVGATYSLWVTDPTGKAEATAAEVFASFTLTAPVAFAASATYAEGQIVTNNSGKFYFVVTGGTDDDSAGPTGTTGTLADPQSVGGLGYAYIGPDTLTSAQAENDAIVFGLILAIEALTGVAASKRVAFSASSTYTAGQVVTNGGNNYLVIDGGTDSDSAGPSGTNQSATVSVGGLTYLYILDAGVTPSATGSAGARALQLLAGSTATWFGVETYDPTLLLVSQNHAAPSGGGLATDLGAAANETTDWYALCTLYNSSAYVEAAATWVESNQKLYPVACCDTTDATAGTGPLATLAAAAWARAAGFFHPRPFEFADAAEMGRWLNITPGQDNWRLKTLAGLTTGWGNGLQYSASQLANLCAPPGGSGGSNANYYYLLAGLNVVGGQGMVAAGEFIDVVRFIDWWVAQVGQGEANLLIQNEKIPYTDQGIGLVQAVVAAANEAGIAAGGIDPGSPPGIPPPSVTVPTAGSVSPSNRATRQLNNVNTSWTLAGAINKLTVNAVVNQ